MKNKLFGLIDTATSAGLKTDVGGPAALAGTLIGYVLAFVGIIFFGLMLYGGFMWMTARGSEEKVKKGQDTITTALVGIAIIFLSYVITRFVVSRLTTAVGI